MADNPFEDEYYSTPLMEYDSTEDMHAHLLYLRAHSTSFGWENIHCANDRIGVLSFNKEITVYRLNKQGSVSGYEPYEFLSDISTFGRADEYFEDDLEDRFNAEFWRYPATLYHGTKNAASVMRQGIHPRSEVRGLNNRNIGDAVFTSTDIAIAEDYDEGEEGGLVAIDTAQMKADRRMPYVSQEPEVLEQEMLSSIAHRFGVEWNIEYGDNGIHPDTIIILSKIPKKYLTRLK